MELILFWRSDGPPVITLMRQDHNRWMSRIGNESGTYPQGVTGYWPYGYMKEPGEKGVDMELEQSDQERREIGDGHMTNQGLTTVNI